MGSNVFPVSRTGEGAPRLPVAKAHKGGANNSFSDGVNLPMFTLGNGRTFLRVITTSSSAPGAALEFILDSVQQFTVTLVNINATLTLAVTHYTGGYWYDQSDDLFYVLYADNINNINHLVTISPAGTITLVGTDTDANYGGAIQTQTDYNYMVRAAHGSGDFTVYNGGSKQVATVNSGTGAATGATPFILTGATLNTANQVRYVTKDGTAAIGKYSRQFRGSPGSETFTLGFMRKDSSGYAHADKNLEFGLLHLGSGDIVADHLGFMEWDGGICIFEKKNTVATSMSINGPKTFEIAAFDAWVQAMCDYIGLPK